MIRVAQGFASSEEHVKLDLETKAPTRRREYFKRLFLHQKPYESERLSTSGFQHTERVGVSSSETSFRFWNSRTKDFEIQEQRIFSKIISFFFWQRTYKV